MKSPPQARPATSSSSPWQAYSVAATSSASDPRTSGQRRRNQSGTSFDVTSGPRPSARNRLAPELRSRPGRRLPRAKCCNARRISSNSRVRKKGNSATSSAMARAAAALPPLSTASTHAALWSVRRLRMGIVRSRSGSMVSQAGCSWAKRWVASGPPRARGAATADQPNCGRTRPHSSRPASPVLISWPLPMSATTTAQPGGRDMMSRVWAGSLIVSLLTLSVRRLRAGAFALASSQARWASSKIRMCSGGTLWAAILSSRNLWTFCRLVLALRRGSQPFDPVLSFASISSAARNTATNGALPVRKAACSSRSLAKTV